MSGPMPLNELPDYIRSARENGQSEVPVVDMGRIVDAPLPWSDMRGLVGSLALAGCVLLSVGIYALTSTRDISIRSGAGERQVAEIVSAEGGRVFSVKREDDGTYRVRVFTLRRMGSFLEGLRGKEEFDSVTLD